MKTIAAIVLAIILSGCTVDMNKAYVGYVNEHAVVLFEDRTINNEKYYRPQFQSDCGKVYDKYYQMDNTSTTCLVRESRIKDLHPYNEHVSKVIPKSNSTIHSTIEEVNSPSILPDNL